MNLFACHFSKALLAFSVTLVLLLASPSSAREQLSAALQKDDAHPPASFDNAGMDMESKAEAVIPPGTGAPSTTGTGGHFGDHTIVENNATVTEDSNAVSNVGIPLVLNSAVDRYIHYFSGTKRELFRRWLKRKSLYEPLISQILQEHGLPEDLVYLAMIESGFNLQAYSPMKAAGPWQFIAETARRYGLTVNYWIDERRDIEKSTIAAARYLDQLFNQFDCWYLAAAAYNSGENRIDRLIKRHDTKDFWQLRTYRSLPRETSEYVPQLIAAAIIAKDPEKYGFDDVEAAAPLEFVGEEVPGGVPLSLVAQAASADLSAVMLLNPELKRGITPPGKDCRIKLPSGTDSDNFQNNLASIMEKGKRVVGVVRHMVKGRENLSRITKRYGVSTDDLTLVNDNPLRLKRGGLVYIPRFDETDGDEDFMALKTALLTTDLDEETLRKAPGGQKAKIRRAGTKTTGIERATGVRTASHLKKTSRKTVKKYQAVRKASAKKPSSGR